VVVTVTATSTNATAARLVTLSQTGASAPAPVAVGLYYTPFSLAAGGIELDPLAAGQTTVSVSAPGFITQQNGTAIVTVNP
jgi:hypothetical protein